MERSRLLDRTSFLEVYRQTAAPLRRYAARALGSVSAAEDVVQETFARALASTSFPEDTQEARAYLFRVTSNLIVDQWRRRRREIEREAEQPLQAVADPGVRLDLALLFARLKLQDRQLIWLAHVEGANHTEIARALGVGAGSVKVLLHRARQRFAEHLRAGGYNETEGFGDDGA